MASIAIAAILYVVDILYCTIFEASWGIGKSKATY
jgi:hypothetical protein